MTLNWTDWEPIAAAVQVAPRVAGVYEARSVDGVVYVGSAGNRRNGVSARLSAYSRGKSPDSGLTGHASTRALTDPAFCRRIVTAAETGDPWTLSRVAVEALGHLAVTIRSAATDEYADHERELIGEHTREQLWNLR